MAETSGTVATSTSRKALQRQDNKLADVLAVAEEHEPDAEKSMYLHGIRERAEVRAEECRCARGEDSHQPVLA